MCSIATKCSRARA